MADTAAFFAKKKKGGKKKAFKSFNANKIDASSISTTVHVDAPAITGNSSKATDLSSSVNGTQAVNSNTSTTNNEFSLPSIRSEKKDDEGWEDSSATILSSRSKIAVANKKSVSELLDMNAIEKSRREQDDVVERMRVEETKAALASARIGMEKEAERLKEAKNKQEAQLSSNNQRVESGGTSGKWVPVHLRGGASKALGNSRLMMSKARGRASVPDTEDTMDFPDLGAANAAIEAQKKQQKERQEKERQEKERQRAATFKPTGINWASNRSSIGGAATMRKKLEIKPTSNSKVTSSQPRPAMGLNSKRVERESGKAENKPDDKKAGKVSTIDNVTPPVKVSATTTVTPASTTPTPVIKKKKKKKKDLSTFKAAI